MSTSESKPDAPNKIDPKWLQILLAGLLGINTTLIGWGIGTIGQIKADLSELKGGNFTAEDGLSLHRDIAGIREQLAKGQDVPPWVEQRFLTLERKSDLYTQKLDELLRRTANLKEE